MSRAREKRARFRHWSTLLPLIHTNSDYAKDNMRRGKEWETGNYYPGAQNRKVDPRLPSIRYPCPQPTASHTIVTVNLTPLHYSDFVHEGLASVFHNGWTIPVTYIIKSTWPMLGTHSDASVSLYNDYMLLSLTGVCTTVSTRTAPAKTDSAQQADAWTI